MISNPNLVLYSCIAHGTIILAQFAKEHDLEALALNCIEKTPPYHSMFSHTVRKRTYTFLIQDPFTYFAVFDEDMDKSEAHWFLHRIKFAFEEFVEGASLKGFDNFSPHCFQPQCDSIFSETLALDMNLDSDLGMLSSPKNGLTVSRNLSLDSTKGKRTVITPLLANQNKCFKKKKRVGAEANGSGKDDTLEKTVDVCDDVNGLCRDFALTVQKSFVVSNERQKAKQIWRKHVWVVLLLDLFVCVVLFVIWLSVCRGFKCIDG